MSLVYCQGQTRISWRVQGHGSAGDIPVFIILRQRPASTPAQAEKVPQELHGHSSRGNFLPSQPQQPTSWLRRENRGGQAHQDRHKGLY